MKMKPKQLHRSFALPLNKDAPSNHQYSWRTGIDTVALLHLCFAGEGGRWTPPAMPFFSCVCLLASMARSVNCLGQKKNCTGPFNWGEAHCAGEIVKRGAGPFQRKSLTNQTRTTTQQRGAARHGNQEPPGQAPRCTGRKNKTNHKKPETSKTNLGTP